MNRLSRALVDLGVVALVGACLAVFALWFLPRGLENLGSTSLRSSYDFHSFFLPKFIYGTKELFAGRLPVWNPYEYGGIPFLATAQPAVFYPLKIAAFGLFEPVRAYWVFLHGHYVLMALSFVLFLRTQNIRGTAAFVGAAFWTFSQPVLMSNYHPTRIANLVWVPVAFALADKVGSGRIRIWFPLLALVVALQLVSGYPEFSLDLALLVAVHSVVQYVRGAWPDPPYKTLPVVALSFILGAVVASAQVLPLAELGIVTDREALAVSGDWRLNMGEPPPFWVATLWLLPALTPFYFLGVFDRRARAGLAGLVFCVAMGQGGWLLMRFVPGFSMVRFPWAWLLLTPFFVAWLAAAGTRLFLEAGDERPIVHKLGGWAAVLFGAAWATLCGLQWFLLARDTELSGNAWEALGGLIPNTVATALGVIAAAALLGLGLLKLRGRAAPWIVIVTAMLLTISHTAGFPFRQSPAPVTRPHRHGVIEHMMTDDLVLEGRTFALKDLLYGYNLTDRHPSTLGTEMSFIPSRMLHLIMGFRFVPMLKHIDWSPFLSARGFLDAMNLQYLVARTNRTAELVQYGLQPLRVSRQKTLFENRDRMGDAWVSHTATIVDSTEAAEAHLLSPEFDPHYEVILEEPPDVELSEPSGPATSWPEAVRRPSTTEVEIEVDIDRPGILVLADAAYPGWEATVDGESRPWFVANYLLRGVALEPGAHLVRFEYRPWSIRAGLWLSVFGLVLTLGWLGYDLSRRFRTSP